MIFIALHGLFKWFKQFFDHSFETTNAQIRVRLFNFVIKYMQLVDQTIETNFGAIILEHQELFSLSSSKNHLFIVIRLFFGHWIIIIQFIQFQSNWWLYICTGADFFAIDMNIPKDIYKLYIYLIILIPYNDFLFINVVNFWWSYSTIFLLLHVTCCYYY